MSVMSELDMERQRIEAMCPTISQRYAVAKLVGYCESIASSGLVGEPMERRLRERIAETLSAFGMEPHQEVVKRIMGERQ
jgi:hypothetical protein